MTLARRLATGDTFAVFVTSRMRTETRASSASVCVSSVVLFTKRPEISISSDTIQNMFSTFSTKFKERNTGDIL